MQSSGCLQQLKTNDDKLLYLQTQQETQHQQHGQKHRRELEDLSLGQVVAMYNPSSKTWGAAEVKDNKDEPQSYDVKTAKGSELRLKCIYLRTVAEKQMIQQTTPEEMSVSKEPPPFKQPSTAAQAGTDKLTVEVTDTTLVKTK